MTEISREKQRIGDKKRGRKLKTQTNCRKATRNSEGRDERDWITNGPLGREFYKVSTLGMRRIHWETDCFGLGRPKGLLVVSEVVKWAPGRRSSYLDYGN